MESIIVNTVSSNANKGRSAIDWVVDAIGKESKVYMSWVEILRSLLSVKIGYQPLILKLNSYLYISEYFRSSRQNH